MQAKLDLAVGRQQVHAFPWLGWGIFGLRGFAEHFAVHTSGFLCWRVGCEKINGYVFRLTVT
jgi:hypothetical protein